MSDVVVSVGNDVGKQAQIGWDRTEWRTTDLV